MTIKSQQGYTYIEVMMTIAIFSVIMGALYTGLVAGEVSWDRYDDTTIAQREARKAMFYLSKDLRTAKLISFDEQTADKIKFSFHSPQDGSITYSWDKTGVDTANIIRSTDSNSFLVATGIADLDITENTNDIDIQITTYTDPSDDAGDPGVTFVLNDKITKRL